MPFFLIRGTYHIKGYSPDGDSLRFRARNKANWAKLGGQPVALNARGHAQLRLEAIDTLETHYKNQHQPLDLAVKALDFLLKGLGITGMQTDVLWTMVTAVQDGTEGYILARTTDKYQRPIAFVYAVNRPRKMGRASTYCRSACVSRPTTGRFRLAWLIRPITRDCSPICARLAQKWFA